MSYEMFGPTPQSLTMSLTVAVSCITPKHLSDEECEALKAASSRPSSMSPKNDFRTLGTSHRPRLSCAATFAPVRCSLLTPFWVVYCSVGSDL